RGPQQQAANERDGERRAVPRWPRVGFGTHWPDGSTGCVAAARCWSTSACSRWMADWISASEAPLVKLSPSGRYNSAGNPARCPASPIAVVIAVVAGDPG